MDKVEGSIETAIKDVYAKDPQKWDALQATIQKVRGEQNRSVAFVSFMYDGCV